MSIKKQSLFYSSDNHKLDYDELIGTINKRKFYYEEYFAENYIDFIVNTILCIIHQKNVTLIDYLNFTKQESDIEHINSSSVNDLSHLQNLIRSSSTKFGIYSSGTTSVPKLIYQPISRLLKSVQINEAYKNTKWSLTYNHAHSAGIQVFLQVIMNASTIFDFYKKSQSYILDTINDYGIEFLSATPTFYRMLWTSTLRLNSIKHLTFNGEKCSQDLIDKMKMACPNASVKNIYGSTESGPLMSSESQYFSIPKRLLDKVKIVDNELMIHSSIMSESIQKDEWYGSGDLVEIIEEDPLIINFISRKSRIINVGGHNVNPQEIEEILMMHTSIIDAQVLPRPHKIIGNLVIANIVSNNKNLTEKHILDFLKNHLALYKVPRIINFVNAIEIGRTGKKKIS